MNKTLIFAILFAFVATTCKKGVDDPEFSLHSRKARMDGEWKMKSGTASFTIGSYNISYTFDGVQVKRFSTYLGGSALYGYGQFTMHLKMKKDGTFTLAESLQGNRNDFTGTWAFNSGKGISKNKEQVLFAVTKVEKGGIYNCFFSQQNATFLYSIQELRDLKLHVIGAGLFYDANKEPVKYTAEFNFEAL